MRVEDADGILLDGSMIDAAPNSDRPVIELSQARNVTVRNSRAATIHVSGTGSNRIRVIGSDSRITADPGVPKAAIDRE
jgi:hypothetical protein